MSRELREANVGAAATSLPGAEERGAETTRSRTDEAPLERVKRRDDGNGNGGGGGGVRR